MIDYLHCEIPKVLWYIIPGTGPVTVMGGFLSDEFVRDYVMNKLMKRCNSEASFRVMKSTAVFYKLLKSSEDKKEQLKKLSLFDVKIGTYMSILVGDDSPQIRNLPVTEPYVYEIGVEKSYGTITVRSPVEEKDYNLSVNPYGVSESGKCVIFDPINKAPGAEVVGSVSYGS